MLVLSVPVLYHFPCHGKHLPLVNHIPSYATIFLEASWYSNKYEWVHLYAFSLKVINALSKKMQHWKTSVKSSIEVHYFSFLFITSLSLICPYFPPRIYHPLFVSYVIGSIQKILKHPVPKIKISMIKGGFYSQIYWLSQSYISYFYG